jgi:hypothetical protein
MAPLLEDVGRNDPVFISLCLHSEFVCASMWDEYDESDLEHLQELLQAHSMLLAMVHPSLAK